MPPRLSICIRFEPTELDSSLSSRQHLRKLIGWVERARDFAQDKVEKRDELLRGLKAKAVVLVGLVTDDIIEAGKSASIVHEDRAEAGGPRIGVIAGRGAVAQFKLKAEDPSKFEDQYVKGKELTLLRGAGD